MSTISDKRGGFTTIENEVFKLNLTAHEFYIYALLLMHTNQQIGVAFPGLGRLAKLGNMSRSQVQKSINSLVSRGLISKRHRISGREYQSNEYEILPLRPIPPHGTGYTAKNHTLYRTAVYPVPPHGTPIPHSGNEQDSLTRVFNKIEGTTVAPPPEVDVFKMTLQRAKSKGKQP